MNAQDTLLGHCIMRAAALVAEQDVASGRRKSTDRASRWDVARAAGKAGTQGSRVASFIVLWAMALDSLDRESIGIEEYARWSASSRPTAYRHNAQFRELWPEHETPNALALQLLEAARAGHTKPSATLALAL